MKMFDDLYVPLYEPKESDKEYFEKMQSRYCEESNDCNEVNCKECIFSSGNLGMFELWFNYLRQELQ